MNRRTLLKLSSLGAATLASPRFAFAAETKPTNDIALLREILLTLHAGLYRYASPSQIDVGLKALERSWPRQSLRQRYLALARFLSIIKCGHTYPNFFNQSDAVAKALFDPEQPTRLPFAFKWIGNQMVVLADHSGTGSLKRGTIVKAVNGLPVEKLLAKLMPYVRADGGNDAKRRALLSATGGDEIETFDVFHGLLFGAPGSPRGEPKSGYHRLHIREPGAMRDAWVDMPAITLSQRKSFMKQPNMRRDDKPAWDWSMRDDGIAVLTMDSWAVYNSKWKWEEWLNERLDSLKGAKGLIVDIRQNEGGLSCGDAILSRFAKADIARSPQKSLVRYQRVPDHLNRYLDTWDDSFRDWKGKVRPFDKRFYELETQEDEVVIKARGPRVDVPMVVLISPQNSSATFRFASTCRSAGIGTLIGEATGGNQRGINGGYFFAKLPESGIEFDVAFIGFFPDRPMPPDAGLEPDIKAIQTADDIAKGYDRALSVAVAQLKGG